MAGEEATEGRSKARAGLSALIQFGAAFDYEAMRRLLVEGLPGGPPGIPEDALPPDDEVRGHEEELDPGLGSGSGWGDATGDPEGPESEEVEEFDFHTQYRATAKAADMISVIAALRRWLDERPRRPRFRPKRSRGAGEAIVSLIRGWSATAIHALAAEPMTLAELDQTVRNVDRETLRRTVAEMLRSGIAETRVGGGETRFALTQWGCKGIAPLIAAGRYERLHPSNHALPPDVLDVEAAFRMSLPMARLPTDLSGRCRLGVWIPGGQALMAGATVEVAGGRVISSTPLLEENPDTWVTGLPLDWFETVFDPASSKLKADGDLELTSGLILGLHESLFD